MLPLLLTRNADLMRLWEDGLDLDIKEGYLFVYQVPYLNGAREIKFGTLITWLMLAGDQTIQPDHPLYFQGELPCHLDGTPISEIVNHNNLTTLTANITADRYFSASPVNSKYADYHEKVSNYLNILSGPAMEVDPTARERGARITVPEEEASVFKYTDSHSAKYGLHPLSDKLKQQKIAIIGLGGTGSYVLDMVAKTPVMEIHLFDGDYFLQHNAFRAPGAPGLEELCARPKKVDYFKGIYSRMHRKIFAHGYPITASNMSKLAVMDFVFLCIDKGAPKEVIIPFLLSHGISFVDTGMGVEKINDRLTGIIRVTSGTAEKSDHLADRISYADGIADEYPSNVQISELNALAATQAVIKWKKISEFYADRGKEHHTTYTLTNGEIHNEDHQTQVHQEYSGAT